MVGMEVEEIFIYNNRLRSTQCMEFLFVTMQTRLHHENYSIITSPSLGNITHMMHYKKFVM